MTRVVSPVFIGRDAELAAVVAALDEAHKGRGRTILIGGEAGVGKSRLLAECLERVRAEATVVLAGGCIPIGETALPFGPVAEALRPLAREWQANAERDSSSSREAPARAIPGAIAELGFLGGGQELGKAAGLRPETARSRVYEAFLDLLRGFAIDRPVVLAIEDLHWADASTRELLSFLIRNGRSERLFLIATLRTDELHRRHPLLSWLGEVDRLPNVERIELRPLDRDEVGRLLAAIIRRTPPPQLVERVYARAEGNPFFVEELVAAGLETEQLPTTLREVLAGRLSRASPATMQLLGVAAVIGRRVDHQLLCAVSGLEERALDEGLQDAVDAGLLVVEEDGPAPQYRFRHALLADAAAETVLPARRARLHAAIAQALVSSPQLPGADEARRLAEIAHHWFKARDLPRALVASVAAAEAIMATGAFMEAYQQFERAVGLWDVLEDPGGLLGVDRPELLRRAAQAAFLAGEFDASIRLVREAIERVEAAGHDNGHLGLLYERLGRSLYMSGAFSEALGAYERALELVPAEPPGTDRVRVVAAYARALSLLERLADSLAVAEPALVAARAIGSRQLEGHLLTTIGLNLCDGADGDRGIALLRQALEIALEIDDVDDIFAAYTDLSCELGVLGRNAESAEVGLAGAEMARERGMTSTWGGMLASNTAYSLSMVGRWDEALRLIREAESGAVGAGAIALQRERARLAILRGDYDEASISLDELEARLTSEDGPQWVAMAAAARIELSIGIGDLTSGRTTVDRVLPILAQTDDAFFKAFVLIPALRLEAGAAERARAARDQRRLEESVRRADVHMDAICRLLADPSAAGKNYVRPAVALGEAEMTRVHGDASPEAWRRVLALPEETVGVHDVAYARFRLAEALLETARDRATVSEARAILAEAHSTAVALGARPLRKSIEGLAARARVPLDAPSVASAAREPRGRSEGETQDVVAEALDRYGLTAREVDVLRLVAAGRTNRQIGEELFISESTAAVHVAHIVAKLGVSGRTEAATVAARIGVLRD